MVTLTRTDGFPIPTIRERGPARRDPQSPDPAPAATRMLRALQPGNEATIDSALFVLAVALAKAHLGTDQLPMRMNRSEQAEYRRIEKLYRAALPGLSRMQLMTLCEELIDESR